MRHRCDSARTPHSRIGERLHQKLRLRAAAMKAVRENDDRPWTRRTRLRKPRHDFEAGHLQFLRRRMCLGRDSRAARQSEHSASAIIATARSASMRVAIHSRDHEGDAAQEKGPPISRQPFSFVNIVESVEHGALGPRLLNLIRPRRHCAAHSRGPHRRCRRNASSARAATPRGYPRGRARCAAA